jgi:hypothetical protein
VVVTRPNPCPATTWDPAKNLASGGASPGVVGHSRFDCGSDSPVREDSSIARFATQRTTPSAAMTRLTQDEQVAGHHLLERHRHDVPVADDIGKRCGGAGQLLERRSGPGFEQDVGAQDRYQGEREHNGIPRLAQQKVDDGRDDQHDGHRVEEKTDDLSNPREAVVLDPPIRADLPQ